MTALGRVSCNRPAHGRIDFRRHDGRVPAGSLAAPDGPDRITRNVYDLLGRVVQVREGVGASGSSDPGTATATGVYSANGLPRFQ